jgi:hypothetical protein
VYYASVASVTASPVATGATAKVRKRNYARIAELTWIWSIVGYSVVRFVIAWGAFGDHGANVWVFGLIDVGTAWPYAKSVAVVCKRAANSQWTQLPLPLGVAVATFFAPYAYLWFSAGEVPAGLRIGMAICVSVLLVAASAGAFAKTRKLRREANDSVIDLRPEARAVVGVADAEETIVLDLRGIDRNSEVVIDLTGDEVVLDRAAVRR